jgi:hypothetical protein
VVIAEIPRHHQRRWWMSRDLKRFLRPITQIGFLAHGSSLLPADTQFAIRMILDIKGS